MDNSFFDYLHKLELLVFFSGYPLVYTICFFIAGTSKRKNNFISRVILALPYGYALVGTLYLGLQLKNLSPDYSLEHIKTSMAQPLLTAWALLSILFWIPAFAKRTVLSLLHSLVFFGVILSDMFLNSGFATDISNEMKVYTTSLLLNAASILLITFSSYLFLILTRKQRLSS